jgi:5-methyltetrahydropteroyltriglutamate--homocysteine methyltransferase
VTFGLHICRGNNQSLFYAAGGYEPIARVFARTRFDRFLLEYDDERSGGFAPLRSVPEDRMVVRLESMDELTGRVAEAAHFVPLERLALSPQCGFASTMEGNRITPDEQRAKRARTAEAAHAIWRS